MMYQALYRKYRPKTFEDVVGQKVIKQTLTNSIINDKISHAYLFTGPRGTGKTSIAKILAKIVNCESLNNITPCNKCVSCTIFQRFYKVIHNNPSFLIFIKNDFHIINYSHYY